MATWVKVPGIVSSGGQPEPNAEIFCYEPGTTQEIPIYSDEGNTQITQPLHSGEAGEFQFYVDKEAHPKIRLYFRKTGVDFTAVNIIYDGITLP